MHGGQGVGRVLPARGVRAGCVAEERRAPGLVERRPVPDPVAERAVHQRGVLGEPGGRVPRRPAAGVFQLLREVPVVQRDPRDDVVLEQLVAEPTIEVQPLLVQRPASARLHARPRDGEPIGVEPQPSHQRDVLAIAVVVVARHVAGIPAERPSESVAERVPDGGSTAVFRGRPLNLVRRGGRPPEETGWERQRIDTGHALTEPSMMPPMIRRP